MRGFFCGARLTRSPESVCGRHHETLGHAHVTAAPSLTPNPRTTKLMVCGDFFLWVASFRRGFWGGGGERGRRSLVLFRHQRCRTARVQRPRSTPPPPTKSVVCVGFFFVCVCGVFSRGFFLLGGERNRWSHTVAIRENCDVDKHVTPAPSLHPLNVCRSHTPCQPTLPLPLC